MKDMNEEEENLDDYVTQDRLVKIVHVSTNQYITINRMQASKNRVKDFVLDSLKRKNVKEFDDSANFKEIQLPIDLQPKKHLLNCQHQSGFDDVFII
jgi:hypothetical protein